MRIIVVGGGKVGRYLINDLSKKGHEVVLVEQKEEKCQIIRNKYDINVVCGDGSEKEVLEKAKIEEADVLLAVTKDDQDNLVICQLAERQFEVPQTFTTVNTPGNEKLFDWLGVNVAVSSASILSALIDQEVAIKDLKEILAKDQDELKMIRLVVADNSPVINKKLNKINLPLESVLVTILRGDKPIVPRGNTKILSGDLIVTLTKPEFEEELIEMFSPNRKEEKLN
ncbi:MAG: potassium channel family protein [Bacillota bacterium]